MNDRFPPTRRSVLARVRSQDGETRRAALETLAASYWRPIYRYLRMRWGAAPDDAQDLTQGFFAAVLEKGFFESYDPSRARFRTWLRTCLDGFVSHERESMRRLKRGGAVQVLPLDFEVAEGELRQLDPADALDMDEFFHREWVRHLFALAVEALRRRCDQEEKRVHFALFERYDIEGPGEPVPPSYADLAAEFTLPVTQVTNHLAWARREFRRLVLETLREITASDDEFGAEARAILGGAGR